MNEKKITFTPSKPGVLRHVASKNVVTFVPKVTTPPSSKKVIISTNFSSLKTKK